MQLQGLIMKGIGGFYYVKAEDGNTYECRARGIFRKKKMAPYAGDRVTISAEEDGTGAIESIEPRKNDLIRPPVANIDQLFIVVSMRDPSPSTLIIDKTIAAAENKNIEPVLVLSKTDLEDAGWLREIYEKAGIPCITVSSVSGEGVEEVRGLLRGKISAFTGNSGVGKSTLLNRINEKFALETGEISQKLGRGRHTTRQVELLPLEDGGYVADTPGFSSLELQIDPVDLAHSYHDFEQLSKQCKFRGCLHESEPHCAVKEAVEGGTISSLRYEHYLTFLKESKLLKEKKYG